MRSLAALGISAVGSHSALRASLTPPKRLKFESCSRHGTQCESRFLDSVAKLASQVPQSSLGMTRPWNCEFRLKYRVLYPSTSWSSGRLRPCLRLRVEWRQQLELLHLL